MGEHCIAEAGIAFMFAPSFHPAMKNIVPVRKALGVRTVFNILGPLLTPAGAKRLMLGVYTPELLEAYGAADGGRHCALQRRVAAAEWRVALATARAQAGPPAPP